MIVDLPPRITAGFDRAALQFKALAAESEQIGAKTRKNADRGEVERLIRAGMSPWEDKATERGGQIWQQGKVSK